jgi:hypothetical protein
VIAKQREDTELEVHGFVYALLTITRRELAALERDISIDTKKRTEEWVTKRQEKLAHAFYIAMTKDQTFQSVNAYREGFYEKVVELAGKVNFHDLPHFLRMTIFQSS